MTGAKGDSEGGNSWAVSDLPFRRQQAAKGKREFRNESERIAVGIEGEKRIFSSLSLGVVPYFFLA